jgi:hypothetical protein
VLRSEVQGGINLMLFLTTDPSKAEQVQLTSEDIEQGARPGFYLIEEEGENDASRWTGCMLVLVFGLAALLTTVQLIAERSMGQ